MIDLCGQRFGLLVVQSLAGVDRFRKSLWNCTCDCGGRSVSSAGNLRSGGATSCGCKRIANGKARRTHGRDSKDRTYRIWSAMRSRCMTKSNKCYAGYGGRGITVCDRWSSFESFFEDMGEAPDGLSIDRINNELGYSPDNCRWATQKEQTRNTRQNVWIEYNGETKVLTDWAAFAGVTHLTLYKRLKRGWSVGEAICGRARATA